MTRAILLVPSPHDPHALLAPGKCGARPPTVEFRMCRYNHEDHGQWCAGNDAGSSCLSPEHPAGRLRPLLLATGEETLALAWCGEPANEGIDRAIRCCNIARPDDVIMPRPDYTIADALRVARACERLGGAK